MSYVQNEVINDASVFIKELLKRIDCSVGKNTSQCPVNGGWADWSEWGACTGECGQVGLRSRTRQCTDPKPVEGLSCIGPFHETVECRVSGCTEDDYEELLSADVLRKTELQFIRKTHLRYPSLRESCLKSECHLSLVEGILGKQVAHYWNALRCVKHNTGCPVFGGWSAWGKWSSCSAWCGTGTLIKCRTCDCPVPTYPNLKCVGDNCTQLSCQGVNCDLVRGGEWTSWSIWSSCTKTCGQGIKKRTRKCSGNGWTICSKENEKVSKESDAHRKKRVSKMYSHSIRNLISLPRATSLCIGSYIDLEPCYSRSCPVDGGWSDWEPWSQCSHGCGFGTQSRSRSCSLPMASNGGIPCIGPVTAVRRCFLQPCQDLGHQAAVFSRDGVLIFSDRGINTRLLHLYIRFKAFGGIGTIISRTLQPSDHTKQSTTVKLSLIGGYLVFLASVGKCSLGVVSHQPININKPKNLYPLSNENVEYERTTLEETYRSLDELILVPCSKKRHWVLEFVVKTTSQDGLLMLMESSEQGGALILSVEPRRVQLHLVTQEGALEVFEVIEPHVGKWMPLKIDYAPDMTYGLTVSGKRRKIIKFFDEKNKINCSDNVMIGDISNEVKRPNLLYSRISINDYITHFQFFFKNSCGRILFLLDSKKRKKIRKYPSNIWCNSH